MIDTTSSLVVRVKDTHIFTMYSFLSTLFYVSYKPGVLADMNHLKEVEISVCFWILDQMYCTALSNDIFLDWYFQ